MLEIITFGCRLNTFESEVIRRRAAEAGLDDAVVVNTCAVTAEAERQARQAIRRARRTHPGARLIVTGCAAEIAPARYAAMAEVDQVLGNREKLRAESYGAGAPTRSEAQGTAMVVDGFEGRARAFLQVQQGCDHSCTFCIIPQGRGGNRSVPIGEIVAQARRLVESGYRELVLTGVDICGFGADLPGQPRLGQLIRRLLALVPEVRRLRLSSLDPAAIDDDLWRLLAEEPRLMPHLHLSLQSGDDLVLKRMKRRHSRAEALALIRRAREFRPGIAFGADLIAGFPTESDAMFAHSVSLAEEAAIDYLHVFPYSARPGTPAARMPQLSGEIVHERAAQLRECGRAALRRSLAARLGSVGEVVIERGGAGHSEHYAPVRYDGPEAPGSILRLRFAALEGEALRGVSA
jgi:threonylcarbamoyladenosine tRNA methylthiotransferase MtaB